MSQGRHFLEFTEADGNLKAKGLKIINKELNENMKELLRQNVLSESDNSKVIQPRPGMCIKTYKVNTNEKFFINFCQSDEIPAPNDVTEQELYEILQADAISSFRVPMSISQPRFVKDKSNNDVQVCDVAINPSFFKKCGQSLTFQDFILALIVESISEKYNIQISLEKLRILQNRKFIGELVKHYVRKNSLPSQCTAATPKATKANLVQELNDNNNEMLAKPNKSGNNVSANDSHRLTTEIQNIMAASTPDYRVRAHILEGKPFEILAEFYVPKCTTSQELNLDIGDDRILLKSGRRGYLFDKFVNYQLEPQHAQALFDKKNKVLQVRIPCS